MADINRFMTPAEIPQPSFFQLPYEQMKEGLLAAQKQQDEVRNIFDAIGNISVNHLDVESDRKAANDFYSYLDKGATDILENQGTGDLRGLRGQINSYAKNIGKMFRPDQIAGKLEGKLAKYNTWVAEQDKNTKLDPNYLAYVKAKSLYDYNMLGGAKANAPLFDQNVSETPDVPKFIQDNEKLIKASIDAAAYAYTNGQYIKERKSSYEALGPEKVKNVIAGLLMNDPTYSKYMKQATQIGYYQPEQYPLLNQVTKYTKDPKTGRTVSYLGTNVNDKNPFATSLVSAMEGLSYHKRTADESMKPDPTRLDWLKYRDEKAEKEKLADPQFIINQGQPISIESDPVNYSSRFESETGAKLDNLILPNAKDTKGKVYDKKDLKEAYVSSFDINGNFDDQKFLSNIKAKGYSPAVSRNRDNPMGDIHPVMDKIFKDKFFGGEGTISNYARSFKKYIKQKPNFVDNSNMVFTSANPEDKKHEGTIFFAALSNAVDATTGGGFEVLSSDLKDLNKARVKGSGNLAAGLTGQEVNGYTVTGYEIKGIDKNGNMYLNLKGKKDKSDIESVVIPNSSTRIKAPERITQPMLQDLQVRNAKDAYIYNQKGYTGQAGLSAQASQDLGTRGLDKPSVNIYNQMQGKAVGETYDAKKDLEKVFFTNEQLKEYKRKGINPINEDVQFRVVQDIDGSRRIQLELNGTPYGEPADNDQEIKALLYGALNSK